MHRLLDVFWPVLYLVLGLAVGLGGTYRLALLVRLCGRATQLRRAGLVVQAHYIDGAEVSGIKTAAANAHFVRYYLDGAQRDALVFNRATHAPLKGLVRVAVDARDPDVVAAMNDDDIRGFVPACIVAILLGVFIIWRCCLQF